MKFEEDNKIIYCKNKHYSDRSGVVGLTHKGYLIHRKNGPAIIWNNEEAEWYKDGKLHREDGPAVEYDSGYKWWFLNGVEYSEKEFKKIINLKNKKKIINGI